MRYKPQTTEEAARADLMEPGEYDFEIQAAEDAISKSSGVDMIKLKVVIFEGGKTRVIYDYLMESVHYKLRNAALSCGLDAEYEGGELDALMFEGRTGRCKVSIQKDKTGNYKDKNAIPDYIPAEAAPAGAKAGPAKAAARERPPSRAAAARTKAPAGDIDDEIPF